ncbi:MAG: hypothetical protein JWP27_850 [Flaviaesturariibacter sp.]|nr:hypothetical protein [Flaviaesturariibacter sp.]
MRFRSVLFLFLLSTAGRAQVVDQKLDYNFKPTVHAARYFSQIAPKGDSGWFRQVWFIPEGSMAMQGWFADADAKVPNGRQTWWHVTRNPRSTGTYKQGKLDGPWLQFDEKGHLTDSFNYRSGAFIGAQYKWSAEGSLTDSAWFDGAGNGTWFGWFANGSPSYGGRIVRDTARVGKWTHYRPEGGVLATETYVDGERVSCTCFGANGAELDKDACEEREASFVGGQPAWARFLTRFLNAEIPSKAGAPRGQYTVIVRFIVDTDGVVSDITPMTIYGFGMEEEVMRLLKRSPRWKPAQQFGRPVKAYRLQPVTFVIQ